ncbi:TIR domain-containing protein [Streptomyces parvulus]|uniref:TIR domain-containing protein n=1 Tax=Streptomyces parvulus TaxID=146923 RepID=UPI001CF96CA2|nr:TIR domain-containing protein [Streptomyces parvulus]
MARKAFYSFHYIPDNWRAAKVRNMGVIEGNTPISDNDWEQVKKGGNAAIQNWINGQMRGKSCTIVLIGSATAGRKWIKYEIEKSWNDQKGVVGIYIHNLLDRHNRRATKGRNPFSDFSIGSSSMSSVVKAYDPPYQLSSNVYSYINENLESWVEEAIKIRQGN